MSLISVEELGSVIAGGRRLAAIDLGTRTIGLAVSDAALAFAHPRPVIRRAKFSADAARLLSALAAEDAAALVVGLPVNMDGTEGPRAQATRAFVRNLLGKADLPVAFWDERLSTVAAERALIDMDASRAERRERIDSAAASFILQGVLDRLRVLREGSPPGRP